MINEHSRINRLLSIALITVLIFSSAFISFENNYVSADTIIDRSNSEQIDELTVEPSSHAKYDGYIVKIKEGKESKVDENSVDEYESTKQNEYVIVDEPTDTLDFIDPEYVEYIEPNYARKIMTESESVMASSVNTLAYSGRNNQFYKIINSSKAWDNDYTGKGSHVAVFDSGLNTKHESLKIDNGTRYIYLKNFVFSYYYYLHNNKKTYSTNVDDGNGHGTFVTGLAAASGSAMSGIAYESSLSVFKIIDDKGNGYVGDLIMSLDDLYSTYKSGKGPLPDVINMSFGGPEYSGSEYAALKRMTDNGVIIIAAVGNEGKKGSPYNYPANYSNVIGVGAINSSSSVSGFSTRNLSVSLVAPGEGVYSLYKGDDTSLCGPGEGTSYAAPMVAGAAALFDQDGAGITREQFLTLIKTTSRDINSGGYDINSGYGILDIGRMYEKISEGISNIKDSYKIVYNTKGGTVSGRIDTIHTVGTKTALPTKSSMKKTGYTFSYWKDQSGVKRTEINALYKGDLTLTAYWTANKYKLKFKGNGGKVKVASKPVTYNSIIGTIKTPKSRKGYNFLGWFTKKSGGTQYYKGKKYTKAGHTKLYARWTKKKVVKFNAQKGVVKKYAKKITMGKKYGTLPTAKRTGYSFKGWYTKKSRGKKITKNSKVKKNKNITLYAHWKKKTS